MSGTTSGVELSQSGNDVHMRLYQGKSLNFSLVWGGETPLDVSGYGAALQIRDHKDTLLLALDTAAQGGITLGAADGLMTFSASPEQTRAIDRAGVWELELTTPAGDVYRAVSGTVSPVKEIVR